MLYDKAAYQGDPATFKQLMADDNKAKKIPFTIDSSAFGEKNYQNGEDMDYSQDDDGTAGYAVRLNLQEWNKKIGFHYEEVLDDYTWKTYFPT